MKPLLGYLFLALGISFGIASNSLAKISEGFTKLTPSVLCILFMCVTMFSIAKAMSALPVGFAYATYSGLTVTGVVLFAVLEFLPSHRGHHLLLVPDVWSQLPRLRPAL